jgi:hypothetical protein
VKLLSLLVMLVYPAVSLKSLQTFSCREIDGKQYLRADYSILCEGSTYVGYATYAAIIVALVPVGCPLGLGLYLYSKRARERERCRELIE